MSTNNELIIRKEKKTFVVYENICVDDEFTFPKSCIIGKSKDLEEAIGMANQYMQENLVEYGISFVNIGVKK